MDTLPVELIKAIAGFLDNKSDIKNFRLVNRTFAVLIAQDLFKYLYIRPSLQSVTRFKVFCRTQGLLTGFVKEVVMLLGNWENLIWQPFLNILQFNGIRLNNGQQEEASKILQTLLLTYFRFLQDPQFTNIILDAFQCLERLQAVTIRREAIYDDDGDDIGQAHDHIGHMCDDGGHAFWRRVNSYGLDLQDLGNVVCTAWSHSDGFRSFKALIDAAYYSGKEIHSWRVEPTVKIEPGILSHRKLLQHASSVFGACRVLRLDLFLGQLLTSEITEKLSNGKLCHALQSATYLENLEVASDNLMTIRLDLLLGSNHDWKHLKEVRITSAYLDSRHFQEFLRRHRTVLRVIWFRRCRLSSGSWFGSGGLIHWLNEVYLPYSKLKVFQLRWMFEPDGGYAGNIIRGDINSYLAC